MKKLGWIALDIDGTITNHKYSVPKDVILYLRTLAHSGWQIVILTGRSYTFAKKTLSSFDFPYVFCAQNGSIALQMPSEEVLYKNYLKSSCLPFIEEVYADFETDFLIYSGMEKGDFCYWRPQKYNDEQIAYLEDLKSRQEQNWHALDDFDPIHVQEFPYIKGFGKQEEMKEIAKRLLEKGLFEVSMIKDPFTEGYFVLQITNQQVNKGKTLKTLYDQRKETAPIIAAGDDYNDISLLSVADQKIAMPTAPDELKQIATTIAPPVEEMGILVALDLAISRLSI